LIEQAVRKMLEGDELALAKLISLAEKGGPHVPEMMKLLAGRLGHAHKIGITGPPGAGKSTLADRLTSVIRQGGATAAVLAVDPTSPFSGGAVLGDRVRMQKHFTDKGVYIRSMASRGATGGLTQVTGEVIDIVDASGKDYILLETVGVGQSEMDILDYADTVVVVLAPDAGDSVQTMKAGLMEIADIFAVNKSDLPHVDQMVNNLRVMVEPGGRYKGWSIPIMACQAEADLGTVEIFEQIQAHYRYLEASGLLKETRGRQRAKQFGRLLETKVLAELRSALSENASLRGVLEKVKKGELDPDTAADSVLKSGISSILRRNKAG
jgi:LAO/AO transport system kinase